jgi:hypothetical protein
MIKIYYQFKGVVNGARRFYQLNTWIYQLIGIYLRLQQKGKF